MYFNIEIKILD